jgi:glycosyltransferase involved in cell wall biosynthesis
MKPLVSVVVNTFNHERYIEQAVVSVIEQDSPSDRSITQAMWRVDLESTG